MSSVSGVSTVKTGRATIPARGAPPLMVFDYVQPGQFEASGDFVCKTTFHKACTL